MPGADTGAIGDAACFGDVDSSSSTREDRNSQQFGVITVIPFIAAEFSRIDDRGLSIRAAKQYQRQLAEREVRRAARAGRKSFRRDRRRHYMIPFVHHASPTRP